MNETLMALVMPKTEFISNTNIWQFSISAVAIILMNEKQEIFCCAGLFFQKQVL